MESLQWRHNERNDVSNHQPHDCLLIRVFRRRSKKTSKLRVTGLCEGNLPMTGEFPAQRTSNAGNVSIWLRHPDITSTSTRGEWVQTLYIILLPFVQFYIPFLLCIRVCNAQTASISAFCWLHSCHQYTNLIHVAKVQTVDIYTPCL